MLPPDLRLKNLYDSQGNAVRVTHQLGASGGEGTVYACAEPHSQLAAKVYHEPVKPAKIPKLYAMLQMQDSALRGVCAWPLDTLHEGRQGRVVGFLMQKFVDYEELHNLYGPSSRKQEFPHADWAFLIATARNIAATYATIHNRSQVIGDVNGKNCLVSKSATVTIIDTDSFHIIHGGRHYLCGIGTSEFVPPELQGRNLSGEIRTANHDNFGLALLCFQLLFLGRHPFSGRYKGGKEEMPLERAMSEFRFAYSVQASAKQMAPPPNALLLSGVSPRLQNMFELAFDRQGIFNQRPKAMEWVSALDELGKSLKSCTYFPWHKYYAGLSVCPWCKLESNANTIIWSPTQIAPPPPFDLDAVWQKVAAIVLPPSVALPDFTFNLTAIPYIPDPALSSWGSRLRAFHAERTRRQAALAHALTVWDDSVWDWKRHIADNRFQTELSTLTQARNSLLALDQQYETDRRKTAANAEALQRNEYLDRHYIRKARINGIGPMRQATLRSYGIETAADITYGAIQRIPGFGPTLTQELLLWRAAIERSFRFDPAKVACSPEFGRLAYQYQIRRRPLEQILRQGPEHLQKVQLEILNQRQALYSQAEDRARAVAQARLDLAEIDRYRPLARKIRLVTQLKVVSPGTASPQSAARPSLAYWQWILLIIATSATAAGLLLFLAKGLKIDSILSVPPSSVTAVIAPSESLDPIVVTPAVPIATPISDVPIESMSASSKLTARVYAGPNTDAKVIRRLEQGEIVWVTGRLDAGAWYRIEMGEGNTGWVYQPLLDLDGPIEQLPIVTP